MLTRERSGAPSFLKLSPIRLIFCLCTHHRSERINAFCFVSISCCRHPKNFGNARIPIDRKGGLSLVDEGDLETCAPLGSSGRRVFCGYPARCLMSEEEHPFGKGRGPSLTAPLILA